MTFAAPFSTGALIAWDTLRVLDIIGGILVLAAGIRVMAQTMLPARHLLTAGLLCFVVSSIGTEIEHLGDHATYRLFFNLTGTLAAAVGLWLARKEP